MTHDSAVRTVVSLVPEIEKRGAAEVLTEHAYSEDLPPAQLEKLAQVYNTLRTVSHIDNADEEDRGASVSLVDVPKVVMAYATGSGREKAAAGPLSFASHDPSVVDLNRALRRELLPLQKAAGEVTAVPDAVEEALSQQISREAVYAALLDVELDLENEMSKLAGELFAAAPRIGDGYFVRDISEFEEEALRRQPASAVKAAGDYLEKFATPHRTKLERLDYTQPLVKYAYEIPHAMGEKLAELAVVVGTHALVKQASEGDDAAKIALLAGMSPDLNFDMTPPPPQQDSGSTMEALEQMNEEGLTSGTEQKKAPPRDDDEKGGKGGGKGGDGDGSRSKKDGAGSKLTSALAVPFAAAGGAVTGAASKADEILHQIVSKERDNKAQRATDMSVEDIKRAMNVRRLIGTDPVLKDADPKAVLEIYNAIAARNPDIAGDMASIRLILREAVSYEGLTLDSQKMLTEVRRNSAQGQKESDELDKKRYSAGSASPIAIAKA
jgi:hypothetical protein